MGASQTQLEILAIILKVMKEIKIMGKENRDNTLIFFGAMRASSLGGPLHATTPAEKEEKYFKEGPERKIP